MIKIDEVPENSILRNSQSQAIVESSDKCLMQLTVGKSAVIYELGQTNRKEVAILQDLDKFNDPHAFDNSGFALNLKHNTIQCSKDEEIGLKRPSKETHQCGLYRAISELELSMIDDYVKMFGDYTTQLKSETNQVSLVALRLRYGKETIFSLFADQP